MEKISVSDLSIGDWVRVRMCKLDYDDPDTLDAKVLSIEDNSVGVGYDNSGIVMSAFVDDLQPIPITAEVLEKNGFELTNKPIVTSIRPPMLVPAHYVYRLTTDNALIDVDSLKVYIDVGGDYRSFVINCVHHIHELQHILRLTKTNKEIVL